MFTGYKFTTVGFSFPDYFINAKAPQTGAFIRYFIVLDSVPG